MRIAEHARRLRLDRRSYGDHGFTSRALAAWKRQRAGLKTVLKRIERAPRRRLAWANPERRGALNAKCPRSWGRGGTDGGETWVSACINFIVDRTNYDL